ANVSGANITYQWIDCNNGNAPISGETNQSFTATANGSYAVIITDTDCGISGTSNCFDVNTLITNTFENPLRIRVHPNPVKDNVSITFDRAYQNINVEVYSMLGQLIEDVNKTNSIDLDVDMSNIPSGNYILRISADGKTLSKTLIKK
ncbi:T9SS type A sorting domain-containing protein, partial [Flavobacteriaceae bacterium]|nr:T9SS type A sorting domain-containing protein [Flavobacteriaceae bacterium]